MNAMPSMSVATLRFASVRARLTARGYGERVKRRNELWKCADHVSLMALDSQHGMYAAIRFMAKMASEGRRGVEMGPLYMLFCLMTTFERILRAEVTTAAQVSSAEDSMARTVR